MIQNIHEIVNHLRYGNEDERITAHAQVIALFRSLQNHADNLADALQAIWHEIDQYYDVDEGRGNIPFPIMEAWEKGNEAVRKWHQLTSER